MAKLEKDNLQTKKNKNNLDYIDVQSYEWTKAQDSKSFQSNLVYGAIIISVAAIYLACGYLLVKKITS